MSKYWSMKTITQEQRMWLGYKKYDQTMTNVTKVPKYKNYGHKY